MREILIQEDVKLVESRIKSFESNTGCELLMVIANSSDPYPAASWRFGVVSSFLIGLTFSYYFEFHQSWIWPVGLLLLTLLMTWVGHFNWAKRLALSDWEIQRECREKAIEYFHTLGTSRVGHKVTAMIMLSRLERNIQLLVDEKLKTHLTQQELNDLIELMREQFKQGHIGLGLIQSIDKLEAKILADFGGKVTDFGPSELSDTIHFIQN